MDHPQWVIDEKGKRVPGRKDVSDAVAGAIHLLVRRRENRARIDVGQEVLLMDQPDSARANLGAKTQHTEADPLH